MRAEAQLPTPAMATRIFFDIKAYDRDYLM
jgi:hypothetical protein